MNRTAVRVRAEFDIDIQHHWCWLKWWDSFHCLLVSPVEPHKCPERAYAHNDGRSTQPRIKVDILIEPPKQHAGPKGKPDGGSNELKLAQAKDYLEPAPYGEHEAEPIEQQHGREYYRNELPHFPTPVKILALIRHLTLLKAARLSPARH